MRRRTCAGTALLVIAASAVVIGVVSCSGPSDGAADASKCIDATATGQDIADGALLTMHPTETEAIKSPTADYYYVAMSFNQGSNKGVWTTTALDNSAHTNPDVSIASVDPVAKGFTRWPDAGKAFGITYPNDQTRAVEACLS